MKREKVPLFRPSLLKPEGLLMAPTVPARIVRGPVLPALLALLAHGSSDFDLRNAPAPLYRDPVYDGAADPSVLWDPTRNAWIMYYTQVPFPLQIPLTCCGNHMWLEG